MIDVEIKSFQSIESIKLNIDGFTALVGRSNIGKSAIVRAIKCALTNPGGTDFVRHGGECARIARGTKKCKCFASVHLVTEGMDLLWEKGDAINQYTLNGKEYSKAERGTPDFLIPDFAPVKVGADKQLIQVSDQFTPIFLLDQSGGVVADILSDVARLDSINLAMRLVEKDRKEASSTRKVREKDVVDLTATLATYDGLDAAAKRARATEARLRNVQGVSQSVQAIEQHITSIRSLALVVKGITTALKLVMPDLGPLEHGSESLIQIAQFQQEAGEREAVVQQLAGVEDLVIPATESLQESLLKFERVSGWLGDLRAFKDRLGNWKGVESSVVPDPEPLADAHDEYIAVQTFTLRFGELSETVTSLTEQASQAEAEHQAILDEFDALGVCPTCSQQIQSNHEH